MSRCSEKLFSLSDVLDIIERLEKEEKNRSDHFISLNPTHESERKNAESMKCSAYWEVYREVKEQFFRA